MSGLQDMIRLLPPVALTLVSAASMAVEIVAGRALAPYVGMSLYSWTIIIAVVLAGLSIGHWIGGALADRARPAPIVAVTLFLAALTTFASLWILRLTEPAAAALDPVSHAGALAMAAFFAPSLLAGVISPLLTTMALAAAEPAKRGRVLGLMYALGAFGAILGTLAAGLVLVSWLGSAASLAAIAGLYGALGALFLGRRAGGPALIAFAALGAGAPTFLPAATCDEESAYYCIRIDDVDFLGRPARDMALDHLAHGFTFGSKGSTSGRLMPEFYLRQQFSMAPKALFSRVGYSGDHSRTIAQVQSGAYQVGAVNYAVWDQELAGGKIDLEKVSVIWTTPTYPDYQWTVRGDVDGHFGKGFKDKVRNALLNMKDPDLLASFPRESFVPASNGDYEPIESTAKAIGLLEP